MAIDSLHLKASDVNKLATESKAKQNEVDKLLANLQDKQAIEKLNLVRVHSLPQQIRTVAKNGQCDQVYHLENCITKIEIVRLSESIKDTFKMFPHISTNGIYVVYICSVICSKNDLSNS